MSLIDISNITSEKVHILCSEGITEHFFTISRDEKELSENFSIIMDKAREYGRENEVFSHYQQQAQLWSISELWEKPKPFGNYIPPVPFPMNSLPDVLKDYITEISRNIQVYPEMCILPALSVLSMCVQGKAEIRNPGGGNTETLNLYTLTIAEPGERKSGVFKALTSPVYSFQREENQRREPLMREYNIKKSLLTKQLETVSKGKNCNPERAMEISEELDSLEPVYPLTLNVTDTTPEALASELIKNNERISILSDEGGIFDILSGLYSSGTPNIDLFLKSYDGSPYNVIRRTQHSINLENPLITFGIMAQTEPFRRAMSNPQFSGRGLVHRFMFAFPESRTGTRTFHSEPVSDKTKQAYKQLIYRLLSMKTPAQIPVIKCDREAYNLFKDYHDSIERKFHEGNMFEDLKEWGNKQVGRAFKIAGILHLCEHQTDELLNGDTAFKAINIAVWAEEQALKAFGEYADNEDDKLVKYVLNKIKKNKASKLSKRDIYRMCRGKMKSPEELDEPLEILSDMGYIREINTEYTGTGRKPSPEYKINPFL